MAAWVTDRLWSLEELMERTSPMTRRLSDVHGYRGVEYGIHDEGQGIWHWAYYPKIGEGLAARGRVKGNRETAIAACKAAIDEWLGPKPSN
jgi:hypothetical protein